MTEPLTLPLLQMQLDQLVPGQRLHLTMTQVERVFGLDDVAAGRIRNFADGHNCAFALSEAGVQFVKQAAYKGRASKGRVLR